jgi:hypothetical protein
VRLDPREAQLETNRECVIGKGAKVDSLDNLALVKCPVDARRLRPQGQRDPATPL